MSVLWVQGPAENRWMGVNRYSESLIQILGDNDVDVASYKGRPKSIGRYLWQFIWLPLWLIFNSHKYDVAVVYQESLSYLSLFLRSRRSISVIHHWPDMSGATSAVEMVKHCYLKCILSMARFFDVVLVPTYVVKAELPSFLEKKELHVVPNLFDFSSDLRKKNNSHPIFSGPDCLKILYVGSEEGRKNLDTVFRSLAKLTVKYEFVKVGAPIVEENRRIHQSLVTGLGLNVKFLDFMSDEQLARAYIDCDVLVAPSIQEGFGRTVIEAQYFGALVVASDIPVFREVLGSAALFVNDYLDSDEWAKALDSALKYRDSVPSERCINNAMRFSVRSNSEYVKSVIYG